MKNLTKLISFWSYDAFAYYQERVCQFSGKCDASTSKRLPELQKCALNNFNLILKMVRVLAFANNVLLSRISTLNKIK
jgi:hypothetical protein